MSTTETVNPDRVATETAKKPRKAAVRKTDQDIARAYLQQMIDLRETMTLGAKEELTNLLNDQIAQLRTTLKMVG